MRLRLVAVGRVRERYIAAALADFRARLRPYHRLEEVEVRTGEGDPDRVARTEGDAILRLLEPGERVWLLERTGEELSSEELARRLERLPHEGVERLTLVVAGTFGTSAALRERADLLWSLSRLTLLHEWARALVLEQIYRAAKIARDEPYHH
ncbi:MAG: 23S rRNA (pseudouridine(1915)-N(3))-methyltransferase RlmH [Candidatus Eremiobacteraeota bacterium]|nr:23S rRNA (pseudouridine(1915)-N(3))-methyltransferase RlmH [Candidatus Eremiobacteraeota bacterium]